MKHKRMIGLSMTVFILIGLAIVMSVSFVDSPILGSVTVYDLEGIRSSENIYCRWNISADTEYANVSWYKNNISFKNKTETTDNFDFIDNYYTTEEDIWNCTVILYNSTTSGTATSSDTIIVDYDPSIFVNETPITREYNLTEDQVYEVIWNSTRGDAQDFSIAEAGTFCVGTGLTYGNATCTPTSSNLGSDLNTSGNVEITFQYRYKPNTQWFYQPLTVNFTIIPVNDPPNISVSDINISESVINWTTTISPTDEEGNFPMTFEVNLTTINETCTNSTDGRDLIINCTNIDPLDVGNHTIIITAIDDGTPSANSTENFTLQIQRANHVPVITYTSTPDANQTDIYTIRMNASDVFDNNTLNFTITSECNITNPWTGVIDANTTIDTSGNITSYVNSTWTGVLTNDHVVCRNVSIIATDVYGAYSELNLRLNISNKNDPPELHNYSDSIDLNGNTLIYDLSANEKAPFLYAINATDPDLNIEFVLGLDPLPQESLIYLTNETSDTFIRDHLNSSTGLINISGHEMNRSGNYQILIIVNDSSNVNDTILLNLTIQPNQEPYFNQTLNFTGFEYDSDNYPNNVLINLSPYVRDDDGDLITNFTDDSSLFNISNEGLINFTATQDDVGIYIINITITESKGATNTTPLHLHINNTNNRPVIDTIDVPAPPTPMVHNLSINNNITVTVTDNDLNLTGTNTSDLNYAYENITINWTNNNLSQDLNGYITVNSTARTLTVNTSLAIGTYNITVIVWDNYLNYTGITTNDTDSQVITFTIYNTTSPPIINYTGYGNSFGNITYTQVENFDPPEILIGTDENISLYFGQQSWDEDIPSLKYEWYYDNILITNTSQLNNLNYDNDSLMFYFDFFQSTVDEDEEHNLTLYVIDGLDSSQNDSFTWRITVTDVNRPIVKGIINNITVIGSRNVNNLDLFDPEDSYGFYDPDYDTDGDGMIEIGEVNYTINYTVNDTVCNGYANIDITNPYANIYDAETNTTWVGHGMIIEPIANGTCSLTFNATDGLTTATSDPVYLNITVTNPAGDSVIEVTETRGTRTVTETQTVFLPLPEEVEKPIPIDIVLPDMVTVYENNSINIPLTVTNTWNETVFGISLGYQMNESFNYSVSFERQYFHKVEPGEVIKTSMTVTNYRIGNIYEILIIANVTQPEYMDTAKIYLNSVEQTSTGTQVKTLIRFARDLLSSNKECQELGEVLNQAEIAQQDDNLIKALDIVNSVINGCKYLISQEQKLLEQPRILRNISIPLSKRQLLYTGVLIALIAGIVGLVNIVSGKNAKKNS